MSGIRREARSFFIKKKFLLFTQFTPQGNKKGALIILIAFSSTRNMTVTKLTIASDVDQYTLVNKNKTLTVKIMTYGAAITHILTPDKTGTIRDVVLGFDEFESYKKPVNRFFGAVVGRYANR